MDAALPSTIFETLVEQVKQEKSAAVRLQIAAKMARLMYDAEQKQLGFLQGASVIAPEFQKLEKKQEERRFQRQEETFSVMAKEGVLAKELLFRRQETYFGPLLYATCIAYLSLCAASHQTNSRNGWLKF